MDKAGNTENAIAELALWMLILLIIIPFILFVTVIAVCCKYICGWGRPGYIHSHHQYSPPLIIQGQSNPGYYPQSSTNFNA